MPRWLVVKWLDSCRKIILKIRWKFRNLTDWAICSALIYHQIQNMFLNEKNGLWYELQGDYYLPCLKLPKEESRHIGIWGQRHLRYLKQHRKVLYSELLSSDGGFSFSGSIQEVIKFREQWKKAEFAEMSQFTEVKFQIPLAFLFLT